MANKLYAIAHGLTGTVYALAEMSPTERWGHIYYYVGQTYNPRARERQHLRYAGVKGNAAYAAWMEKLARAGKEPLFVFLDEYVDPDELDACERNWILKLLKEGHPLVNQAGL